MAVVFLLITVGRGGGDIESPLIRAGYRLALGGGSRVARRVKRAREKELECGLLESIAAKPLTPVINVGNTSISLWMKIRESMLTSAQYQNAALAFTNK